MKKIVMGILILLGLYGISYGYNQPCQSDDDCTIGCCVDFECKSDSSCILGDEGEEDEEPCSADNCDGTCEQYGDTYICVTKNEGIYIDNGGDCLLNGQCHMNVYEMLGIRESNQNPDVTTFAQDIVLGATWFFGTVIAVIFIISGIAYVMAGYTGKEPTNAKKMMIGSIIGLIFVSLSYTIIRLIQFLASGG